MSETIDHRIIRSKSYVPVKTEPLIQEIEEKSTKIDTNNLWPEHHYFPRPPRYLDYEPTSLPAFVTALAPKVQSTRRRY